MDKHKKKSQKYSFSDSEEQLLARQLDYAKDHPEMAPPVEAPPDEFQKIMAELEKKGVTRRIQQELLNGVSGKRRKVSKLKKMILIGTVASVIVATTAVGVSAKKAYNFRVKYVDEGGQKVRISNYDRTITVTSDLDKAYLEIEKELGTKSMKLSFIPTGLVFDSLEIDKFKAEIQFLYKEKNIYFVQGISQDMSVSTSINADSVFYKSVENKALKLLININKNNLASGDIEYSSIFIYNGTFYHLQGIMDEDSFVKVIEGLRL